MLHQMRNDSHTAIAFNWENIEDSWYIVHIEPTVGELLEDEDMLFELSLSASSAGKIEHQVLCRLAHVDEPLSLMLTATVKQNEVKLTFVIVSAVGCFYL